MASRRHGRVSAILRESGQSLTETVVFLPVLVVLFLGMFYLKGLVDLKMRAVEAARYVTWENTWVPRENGSTNKPVLKSDAVLQQELVRIGLGQGLRQVQGARAKRTLQDYFSSFDSVTNKQEPAFFIPALIQNLFSGNSGLSGQEDTGGFGNAPSGGPDDVNGSTGSGPFDLGDALGPIGDLVNTLTNVTGAVAFFVHDFFGRQTDWGSEVDQSVITSRVVYQLDVGGGGQLFRSRFITETSSILSHGFNVKRTNNATEFKRLVGDGLCGSGQLGHIYDLWLYPSGPLGSGSGFEAAATALRVPKCIPNALGGILEFLDNIPGINVGYRMPEGTFKEYPELDGASSGSGGDSGGGFGSGTGGGNPPSGGIGPSGP